MHKHGVVMVTLLILALSLLGAVSASNNMTASDVDTQLSYSQGEYLEIDYDEHFSDSSDENSADGATFLEDGKKEDISLGACDELADAKSYSDDFKFVEQCSADGDVSTQAIDDNYELGHNLALAIDKLLNFESCDEILVICDADLEKIDDVTAEKFLNGIMDASNGHITYDKGNLFTLSSKKSDLNVAFFVKNGESLNMAFYENGAITSLYSGDGNPEISAGLWNKLQMDVSSWANGVSDEIFDESGFIFGRYGIQTLLGYENELGLPCLSTKGYLSGASRDSDDNAFIWSMYVNPDKAAYMAVDSKENKSKNRFIVEDKTSKTGMITVVSYNQSNIKVETNLNSDKHMNSKGMGHATLTADDFRDIAVEASNRALNHFKSKGVDLSRIYSCLYVITNAGYVRVNGMDTTSALYGVIEVFGLEIGKNLLSVNIPLENDLVFYFLWISESDNNIIESYIFMYDVQYDRFIEFELTKEEIDYLNGILNGDDESNYHSHGKYCQDDDVSNVEMENNITKAHQNKTDVKNRNSTNGTVNATSGDEFIVKPVVEGNPYNIVYTISAIVMIFVVFALGYAKD